MSTQAETAATIEQHLPWVVATMDYTDRLAALIPEDLLDWRPNDPRGGHMFSLAEYVMHLADERRELARQLAGDDSRAGFWTVWSHDAPERPGLENPWVFLPRGDKAALLASLSAGRAEVQPWLDRSVAELHQPTPGTQAAYERYVAEFEAQGKDADALRLRGPATLNRVLFALACHEAGHRGSLQALLRLNGIDARGEN